MYFLIPHSSFTLLRLVIYSFSNHKRNNYPNTSFLLHTLHVSISLYPKRSNIFPWTLKKLVFPLYGWDVSFKATGLLETSSLLLNNNFQGIFITYFMGFSIFNGWVSYRPNWRVMVNPFTWSTWKVPIMDIKS